MKGDMMKYIMLAKQIFKTLSIFAVIFWITACNDNTTNKRTVETLKIKEIWQGNIPEKFQEALLVYSPGSCGNDILVGDTFLLLPEKISTTETLHVQLYGCWSRSSPNDPADYIIGEKAFNAISCYVFYKGLDINRTNKNQISLTVQQHVYPEPKDALCVTAGKTFEKRQTYDINSSWQSGELQIVIQNPDDQNLTATIIVE